MTCLGKWVLVSHVLRMGRPILFFREAVFCLNSGLGDLGWSGAGTCPSRVWKVPKETAPAPNRGALMLESPGWIRDRG